LIARWRAQRAEKRPSRAVDDEKNAVLRSELGRAVAQRGAKSLPRVLVLGPAQVGKSALIAAAGKAARAAFSGVLSEKILEGETDTESHIYALSDCLLIEGSRHFAQAGAEADGEWFNFLDVLREQSREQPLSGLVLVVSVDELLDTSEQQIESFGHLLRERIDDAILSLGVIFPIYVVMTKADLLTGFVELFDRCDEGELAKDFGFLISLAGPGAEPISRITRRCLLELQSRVDTRVFSEVEVATDLQVKANLIDFSRGFSRLSKALVKLAGELFPDHGEPDAPIFRGLYFTSATTFRQLPVGLPVETSNDFGLSAPPPAPTGRSRLYFLQNIPNAFKLDRWIVYPDPTAQTGRRVRRVMIASCLMLFAVGSMVFPWLAMKSNRALVIRAEQSLRMVRSSVAQEPSATSFIRRGDIAPLFEVVRELEGYEVEGVPFRMRLGMYQGARLVGPIVDEYVTSVRTRMIRPIVERDVRELQATLRSYGALKRPPTEDDYWLMIDRLRRVLLLADVPEKISLTSHRAWLVSSVTSQWAEATGVDSDSREKMVALVDDYFERLSKRPELLIEVEERELVERVRVILERQERGNLWIEQLHETYADRGDAKTLKGIVDRPWLQNGDRSIPYIFTRDAWDKQIHKNLDCNGAEYDDERSVLLAGLVSAAKSCSDERESLYEDYFQQYIAEWTAFLKAISTRTPSNELTSTAEQLDSMTSSFPDDSNPLRNLFITVRDEVSIDFPVAKTEEEAADTGEEADEKAPVEQEASPRPSPVGKAFVDFYSYGATKVGAKEGSNLPISTYLTNLNSVYVKLDNYLETREPEMLKAATSAANELDDIIAAQVQQIDDVWSPTFGQILRPPLIKLSEKAKAIMSEGLSSRWCQEVVEPFDLLEECYPFTDTEDCDVPFSELAELLHPQSGRLWAFYDTSLKLRYPEANGFKLRPQGPNEKYRFKPQVGDFLLRARDLGNALFPTESKDPKVEFNVLLKPAAQGVQTIEFSIDGEKIVYENAKQRKQPMVWPGDAKKSQSSVRVQTRRGKDKAEKYGPWSLFRLLEEGQVASFGKKKNVSTIWELKGHEGTRADVELQLFPRSHATPFFGSPGRHVKFMDVFRAKQLRPPRQLISRGRVCVRHTVEE